MKHDANREFYDMVAKIYEDITKNNKAPWLHEGMPVRGIAYNPKSGVIFKGVNSMMLEMKAAQKGYKDSRWLSSAEIAKLGVKIKKGEQATPIAYSTSGESFDAGNPKQRYYFMFNAEQLRGLEMRNDKNFIVDRGSIREKIKNTIEKTKTNDFPAMKAKLVTDAIKSAPNAMKTLVATMASYRLAQEFHVKHKVPLNDDQKKELTTTQIKQEGLMKAIYQTEDSKNRFISKDNQVEKTQRRTVTHSKQNNKGMEL